MDSEAPKGRSRKPVEKGQECFKKDFEEMSDNGKKIVGAALVVGGGVGGMQAALDLAESGIKVYLVESKSCIGGVMAQLDKTFPTNDCSMCIVSPRLVDVGRHNNIRLITNAEVETLTGSAGGFKATVVKKARSVNEEKCTGCGICSINCPTRNEAYVDVEPEEVELSPDDLSKVSAILKRHSSTAGPLMPVLQDVNAEYGYLPPDVLRYVARELGITVSRVYNIATFYSAFSLTPRGRHVIQVCLGTTCYVRGAENLIATIEKETGISPGQTTSDLRFSLDTVRCLGCCSLAPVMRVGEETFGRLKQRDIPRILEKFQ